MLEIEKEAELFCRYLTRRNSTPDLVIRYRSAIDQLNLLLTEKEEQIVMQLYHNHYLLPYFDGGMAISNPGNGIRKRLLTLSALLETEKDFVDSYLTRKDLNFPIFRFFITGFKAAATSITGYLLVKLLKWK